MPNNYIFAKYKLVFIFILLFTTFINALSEQEFEFKKQQDIQNFKAKQQTSTIFTKLDKINKGSLSSLSTYLKNILLITQTDSKSFKEHVAWLKYKTLYGKKDTFLYANFYGIFLNRQRIRQSSILMNLLAIARLETDSLRCDEFPSNVYEQYKDDMLSSNIFSKFKRYPKIRKLKAIKLAIKLENYQLGREPDKRLCNYSFIKNKYWLKKREKQIIKFYKEMINE
jgi:hypothetical protein